MRSRFILIIVILAIIGSILLTSTNFYLDLLWFRDLDAGQVFWIQYLTQWGMRIGAFIFILAVLFINLLFTRRYILSFPNLALRERLMASGMMRYLTPRRLIFYFLAAAAFLAYVLSGYAGSYWMELLRYLNHVPFNISDPIFGTDVSFYVFKLPFYRFVYSFLMMTLVVSLIIVGAIYLMLNPSTQGKKNWMLPPNSSVSHLAVLLALIFGLKAWDYRLKQFELVLSERGVVYGAGYTDIHANYPVLMILMYLALVIALVFVANIFLRRYRLFIYGILVLTGVSMLGGGAYPAAIQSFVVEPSEFNFEREYLEHNIAFTRMAYGVEEFATRRYDPSAQLTWDDLRENSGTINNVRLWDYRPLLTTFNELQAIRLYYRFTDVDVDRYVIDDSYRQVMIAARELDKSRLAAQAQTWVNLQLQWTHGYGVTISPVNEVTNEGLPRYFLGDIPPIGNVNLDNPAIYFGELTNDYVIVNTDTPEFHYATAGDVNEFTFYDGEAGVEIHSFLRRALFALKFGEYRILVSNELSNESKVLFDRNIHERVRKLAPFLSYDGDPYIVVDDGRLFWIQDAYTATSSYPYAAPYGNINYIRNSVKVVIDAYNGSVRYYIVDPSDPLVQTYAGIFPELFSPMEEMPIGLMAHLRYPEDLFNIQAQILTLYHITDPNVFYTREDLWAIPLEQSFGQEQNMEPYYTILQLPGYSEPEYVLILPFTPDQRNNMIAWMVARCDQPNYGDVEIFLFPKERVILGPNQIENRIDQSTEISEQFTLWGQAGSRVIRGNLLVLPINNALLYVEPIFLEAEGGGLPELARVIVVFGETVIMEDTLEKGLIRVFGEIDALPSDLDPDELPFELPEEDQPPADDLPAVEGTLLIELIRRAQSVYEEALMRQQEGDWAGYGEKIGELEQILNDLSSLTQ
ncbi:MAG: UPF0182 family protein [Firmicutes bacterium]|nr:UPF0182 family protein [Bacillota bacterium]